MRAQFCVFSTVPYSSPDGCCVVSLWSFVLLIFSRSTYAHKIVFVLLAGGGLGIHPSSEGSAGNLRSGILGSNGPLPVTAVCRWSAHGGHRFDEGIDLRGERTL